MEIKSNKLSKKTLAIMVDQFRLYPITDKKNAVIVRLETIEEVVKIASKQKKIEKEMNARKGKITVRSTQKTYEAYNKLVEKYNRLGIRGNALLKSIKEIEKHYPELKKKESESCQETLALY